MPGCCTCLCLLKKLLILEYWLKAKILISQEIRLISKIYYILSLRWYRSSKVRDYYIHKLAHFKQKNFHVCLIASMGGSTCYILVPHLRMFSWLCEKYKHTGFFCTISFHIEECSWLDLLFRGKILKKNIRLLPLYLRGSCMLFWVTSAF